MEELSTCGCCSGVSLKTPMQIYNRPGLTSLAYRIGRHKDFRASLLSKLSGRQLDSLLKLTTRSDNDFTIALLDSFSIMADVLTFYQERLANEAYLKTSTELLSITELARLIGYELNPGVAATTFLSFTLDENSNKPGEDIVRKIRSTDQENTIIKIPVGMRSQSIPEPGEDPQIFETIQEIKAKSDWNAMGVKSFVKQDNILNASVIFIQGMENNINKGDQILVIENGEKKMRKVIRVELRKDTDTTAIYFNNELFITAYLYNFQLSNLTNYYVAHQVLNKTTVTNIISGENKSNKISAKELQSTFSIQNWSKYEFKKTVNFFKPTADEETRIYVFRNKASLFGYNAPVRRPVFANNGDVTYVDQVVTESNNTITLDSEYPEVTSGEDSFIALKRGTGVFQYFEIDSAELLPQAKYGMSAKSTKIQVRGSLTWNAGFSNIRNSIAYIQSEKLSLTQKPITTPIESGSSVINLDKYYVDLMPGQHILISGEIKDLPGIVRAEVHTIREVSLVDNVTQIVIERNLKNSYIRDTVTINANVALASHGETVNEILGSGNTAIPFQRFYLKHNPLTYIADNSSTGSSSTLEIRVNEILWKEVAFFYGQKPDAQIYTISHDDEGNTVITFGDGKHGERLPTGNLNVRATYRKGIGSSGLVRSNQITQLLSRPHYLKTVNNPLASEGAEDAEKTENARENANLNIFTLNRIVSIKDYEDFARSFAGIEKAQAIWLWSSYGKVIHLTVAGAKGEKISKGSELRKNLISAIQKYSYPGVSVEVDSYLPRYFQIQGNLKVADTYNFDLVHEEVTNKLTKRYSFENRHIGEHVFLSKIIAEIESVEGVEYVDIDRLFITGLEGRLNTQLTAKTVRSNPKDFRSSELIQLDPGLLQFSKI